MALTLVKGIAYLAAGAVLVWVATLPDWATYAVGCWCGANAMGYLVAWAMARVDALKAQQVADATAKAHVLDFMARHGKTTH